MRALSLLVILHAGCASVPHDDVTSADAIYREGHARFAADDCAAALPILARAADMDRARGDAIRDIATCKRMAGDREGACAAARELIERDQLRGASARATLEMLCPPVTASAPIAPSVTSAPIVTSAPPSRTSHLVPELDDTRAPASSSATPTHVPDIEGGSGPPARAAAGTARGEAERVFREAHRAFVGGDCDKAMPGLAKSAAMDPTYGEPLRDMAMCQKKAGQKERACSAAKEFVRRRKLTGPVAEQTSSVFCN